MRFILTVLVLSIFSACSSTPPAPTSPDWIRKPTRSVDAGYMIFVGTGEDATPEKSTFRAESGALQDLANECSFAPKGTRIEDHFQEKSGHTTLTYAKVGISFIDCDAAKAANDPESIKKLASTPLADQLKRYQELISSPDEPAVDGSTSEKNPMLASKDGPPASPEQYYVARQRVVYLKQTIILAPETVYVPSAPQTVAVTQQLSTSTQNIQTYEHKNPEIKTSHQTWSQVHQNLASAKASGPKSDNPKKKNDLKNSDASKKKQNKRKGGGHRKRRSEKSL